MTWSDIKEMLRGFLGPFYEPLRDIFWGLWSAVVPPPSERLYWPYIVSALAVAVGVYFVQGSEVRGFSFRQVVRFCLPRSIYRHRSAIVDYKFYFTYFVLIRFVSFGSMIVSAALIGQYCESLLQFIFGEPRSLDGAGLLARSIYSFFVVVAIDLGFFMAHYIEHKVPFFWEFHKVHHSAEVLTPVSSFRFHPIDKILQGCFISFLVGIVNGTFGYACPNGIDAITIVNFSIILFTYNLTANLRHSHIWISYSWAPSHVFSSPAMHQIHHSAAARHIDKNLGLIFSFWDYLAGTLYVPRQKEELELGLRNQEHKEYSSVWNLYALPVKKAARLVIGGIKRV